MLTTCRKPGTHGGSCGDLSLFTFLCSVWEEGGVHWEDSDAWLRHQSGHSCTYPGGMWLHMTWEIICSHWGLYCSSSCYPDSPLLCSPVDPQSGEHPGSAVVGVQRGASRWAGGCGKEHGHTPPPTAGPEGHPSRGAFCFLSSFLLVIYEESQLVHKALLELWSGSNVCIVRPEKGAEANP